MHIPACETQKIEILSFADALVSDSQTGLTEAMNKLNAIDIDTLNKAIESLADVIEPLAKLSNIFGK